MSTEPNDLKHLEIALAGLSPITARLDRDGLLHTAGRMDGERKARPWKAATAACAAIVVALGAWSVLRGPRVEERVVVVHMPAVETPTSAEKPTPVLSASENVAARTPAPTPLSTAQLEARWRVLRFGADALPEDSSPVKAGNGPPVYSLEHDLDMPRGSFKGLGDRRLNATAAPW